MKSLLLFPLPLLVTSFCLADDNLKPAKLGTTRNVHAFGGHLLCGQPSAKDFALAKKTGIKTVITLRTKGEVRWDEPGVVKKLGLEFHRIGFRAADSLTDDVFNRARKILADKKRQPLLLHCGSANRVGAIWAAHRVLDHGIDIEQALKEAKRVGLRTPGYQKKVLEYIKRSKK